MADHSRLNNYSTLEHSSGSQLNIKTLTFILYVIITCISSEDLSRFKAVLVQLV